MQSPEHAERTRAAARIIGPLLLIIAVWIAVRGARLALMLPALFQDGPLVLITALFTLIAGLTLLALHHHWSSPASIVVSVLAVATVFRGVLLLFAPELASAAAAAAMRIVPLQVLATLITALAGAWLSWVGWLRKAA